MNNHKFLALHRDKRKVWEDALGKIPAEKFSNPMPGGAWSVKDIIAHITWYEREMVGMLRARAVAGSPLWEKSLDERNQEIYLQNKDRKIEEVLDETGRIHAELMVELVRLSDEELNDPKRWKDWLAEWTGGWTPWKVIASNTYEHYEDHLPDLFKLI